MTVAWSTAQVHPPDRVAYWVDQVCDALGWIASRRDTVLFGDRAVAGLAGALQIGRGASTAQPRRAPARLRAPYQFTRRVSVGVLPKCCRNARLKCDRSLNPAANAMALIVRSTIRGSKSI
jgi:hypothetical protein